MIDATAGTLWSFEIAGTADRIARGRTVSTKAGPQVTVAVAAIEVAAARRTTVAKARAGGVLVADEVDAAATFVFIAFGVAELARGQTEGRVVALVAGTAIVEDHALARVVDVLASARVPRALRDAKARARSFSVDAGR